MVTAYNIREQWCIIVAAVNAEQQWGLNQNDQQRYLVALQNYVAVDASEELLRRTCINYHLDHQLVQALHDHQHPNHQRAWTTWMAQVFRILRKRGLGWASDRAVDLDDLAQIAQMELLHALPNFRYASRFATWAHTVVERRIWRYIRDSQAVCRAQRPTSLEQEIDRDALIASAEQLETTCAAQVLATTCATILSTLPDRRLGLIFHLWAIQDRPPAEIGALVDLHPSRVRALLVQIRFLLQNHPDLKDWSQPDEDRNLSDHPHAS